MNFLSHFWHKLVGQKQSVIRALDEGAMKYYYYISDSKIDMLLPQIGEAPATKITSEVGFNLKLFSAKRTKETNATEDRIDRLEQVTSFIRRYGNLGSIATPDEYIEDTLPMTMLYLNEADPPVVYFTGQENDTIVGLGGSPKHLIGNVNSKISDQAMASLRHVILSALYREVNADDRRMDGWQAIEAVAISCLGWKGEENLRFMAKRLAVKETALGHKMILGTPLYVAKED